MGSLLEREARGWEAYWSETLEDGRPFGARSSWIGGLLEREARGWEAYRSEKLEDGTAWLAWLFLGQPALSPPPLEPKKLL